jgi:hypothetical protein
MKSVFFIEAKKPIYDLKTNETYIRQVYQYAWSTLNSSDNPNNQVRLALLTDFEEFRFFDCQDASPLKQNRAESFNKHIIKDWTYQDYINKFDELWDLFEYNNVVNGSFEKWYLTSKQLADNRITPDKQFLEDLKHWRLEIARSMYRNDKTLDDFRLTKATLLYINRLIFVKMLADRNIEPDYLTDILDKLNKSKKSELKLYELCKDIFLRLDHIYNGSMFTYDSITDELVIDNSVLKNIFSELKPENSIYTLAAMPVEIIGNVYELFIAEQIVKKAGSLAIVPKYDEKKAGGVYYTPRYIVEYIVDNTLGKKLEECETPEEVSKIKVLDPACGSGSFLIVAYQKLLDWHKKYYYNELVKWDNSNPMLKHGVDGNDPSINPTLQRGDNKSTSINPTLQRGDNKSTSINPTLQRGDNKSTSINPTLQRGGKHSMRGENQRTSINPTLQCGDNKKFDKKIRVINNEEMNCFTIHLSHKLKSDILTNNIYGVDIDEQAVLVTKFSLSIKALEDSTHDEVIEDNSLFKMPAIPKLENNIKCGNSLIGSDFYVDNRPSLFNEKEKRKINTFDWEKEFPEIFIKKENEGKTIITQKIDSHLNAAVQYIDGAAYHSQKASEYLQVLDNYEVKEESITYGSISKGGFDVIIGNPPYGVNFTNEMKIYLKNEFFYGDTEFESYIFFIEKSLNLLSRDNYYGMIVPSNLLTNSRYKKIRELILKYQILELVDIGSNVFSTAAVDTCIFTIKIQYTKLNLLKSSVIKDKLEFDKIIYKQIEQSNFEKSDYYLFNINKNDADIGLEEKIMKDKIELKEFVSFARGIEYGYNSEFTNNKPISKKSKRLIAGRCINRYSIIFQDKYIEFDENDISNFKSKEIYENKKILMRRIGLSIIAAFDIDNYYNVCDVYNLLTKKNTDLKYILGLLNSKVLSYFLRTKYYNSKKLFPKIPITYLEKLPIPKIDFTNRSEKLMHDKLVQLVEQMLENQKYLHEAKSDDDKKLYHNICDSLDKQINQLVYKLYDLSEEEIRIVEDG